MWTCHQVHSILRGDAGNPPKELLDQWLNDNAAELKTAYTKDSFDRNNLKGQVANLKTDHSISNEYALFVQESAEKLNLSLKRTYSLLNIYLVEDYVSHERDLKLILGNQRKKDDLFQQLQEFYKSEQRFAFKILIEILQSEQSSNHPLKDSMESFTRNHIVGRGFLETLETAFKAIESGQAFPLPMGPIDQAKEHWIVHGFQLQCEILEVYMWYIHVLDFEAEEALQCFKFMQETNWCRKQSLPRLVAHPPLYTPMLETVQRLALLLSLQLLDVDHFLVLYRQQKRSGNSPLFVDSNPLLHHWSVGSHWTGLEAILSTTRNTNRLMGPVYVAWACLIQLRAALSTTATAAGEEEEIVVVEIDEVKLQKLGSMARDLDVPEMLTSLLVDTPMITGNKGLRQLAASVVYALIDGFLTFYDPASLGSFDCLIKPLAEALSVESASDEFWAMEDGGLPHSQPTTSAFAGSSDSSSGGGVAEWTRDLLNKFPLYWEQNVSVLTGLFTASPLSAYKAVTYLQEAPTGFAEGLESVRAEELSDAGRDDDGIYSLRTDRYPLLLTPPAAAAGSNNQQNNNSNNGCGTRFVIPAGTLGRMVTIPDASGGEGEGGGYIQWNLPNGWNGWVPVLDAVEIVLRGNWDRSSIQRATEALSLVDAAIRSDDSLISKFTEFINAAMDILKFAIDHKSVLVQNHSKFLDACMSLLAGAARAHGTDIVRELCAVNVIPGEYGRKETTLIYEIIQRNIADGLPQSFVVHFISLLVNALEGGLDKNTPEFTALIRFLYRDIFPAYLKWEWAATSGNGHGADEKGNVTKAMLRLANSLLRNFKNSRKGNEAGRTCCEELLDGNGRDMLLTICALGPDYIQLVSREETQNSDTATVTLVALGLSVLSLLLDIVDAEEKRSSHSVIVLSNTEDNKKESTTKNTKNSLLPASKAFVAAFTGEQQQTITALAGYILYRGDTRLAKLSLICLRKFADLSGNGLLSGWLTETESEALVDGILNRLEDGLMEDIQLKVYCLQFLAVCVENQPGVADKLLNAAPSSNTAAAAGGATGALTGGVSIGGPSTSGISNQQSQPILSGCLLSVWEMLNTKQLPQVWESAYSLILTFWRQRHRVAVKWFTQQKNFWNVLCLPLLAGEEDFYLKIASQVLRIIAEEIYWKMGQKEPMDKALMEILKGKCSKRTNSENERPSTSSGAMTTPSASTSTISSNKTSEHIGVLNPERISLLYAKLSDLIKSSIEMDKKKEILESVREFLGVLTSSQQSQQQQQQQQQQKHQRDTSGSNRMIKSSRRTSSGSENMCCIELGRDSKDKWMQSHLQLFHLFMNSSNGIERQFDETFPLFWSIGQINSVLMSKWLCGSKKAMSSVEFKRNMISVLRAVSECTPSEYGPTVVQFVLPPLNAFLEADISSAIMDSNKAALSKDDLTVVLGSVHKLLNMAMSLTFELRESAKTPDIMAKLFQAIVGCVLTLKELHDCFDPEQARIWLDELHRHSSLRSLVLVAQSNTFKAPGSPETELNQQLVSAVLVLTAQILRQNNGLAHVEASKICEFACIQLLDGISSPSPSSINNNNHHKLSMVAISHRILSVILPVYQSGLSVHSHQFLGNVLTFIGCYSHMIWNLLVEAPAHCRRSSTISLVGGGCSNKINTIDDCWLDVAKLTMGLLEDVAAYRSEWIEQLGIEHYRRTTGVVRLCILRQIALLSKPGVLHRSSSKTRLTLNRDSVSTIGSDSDSEKEQKDSGHSSNHKKLLELFYISIRFLRRISPDLFTLLSLPGVDVEAYDSLLSLEYSTNVAPDDTQLTFGAMFQAIQICVSALRRSELSGRSAASASPSVSKSSLSFVAAPEKETVSFILESCIEFTIAQGALMLIHPAIDPQQSGNLKRELAAELGSVLTRCIRYSGGSPVVSGGTSGMMGGHGGSSSRSRSRSPRRSNSPFASTTAGGDIRDRTPTGTLAASSSYFNHGFMRTCYNVLDSVVKN